MKSKKQKQVEEFLVQAQQTDLALSPEEVNNIMAEASAAPEEEGGYLELSRTIPVRPTRMSQVKSLFFEHALQNEYIYQIGKKSAIPVRGGRFWKIGRRFQKYPASVQTVYFTSDNANKNYQGLRVDGYACYRIDPDNPQLSATCLDFSDIQFPMANTNRLLRTICTEAIRHIIANLTIDDALTKKDEIGRQLKEQLGRVERTWGILFDQVGIERVTILSNRVFEDLQQKMRDDLRLSAADSRMATDQEIAKKQAAHDEEIQQVRSHTEREKRILTAKTETEIHQVELVEQTTREAEDRQAQEARDNAEALAAERVAQQDAEKQKQEAIRLAEIAAQQIAEEQKTRAARAKMESAAAIDASEQEARVAAAQAKTTLARAETEREIAEQQLAIKNARLLKEQEAEAERSDKQQTADLARESNRLTHKLKADRERNGLLHDVELKRLERSRIEEEIKNLVGHDRVKAELVRALPEIAAAQKIDRFTVLSGNGESPISLTLTQILNALEDGGLGRFFGRKDEVSTESTQS